MKQVVFAAALVAGVGAAGAVSAADLGGGTSLKDGVGYAPAPIWTGYYIGGHIGALWGPESKIKLTETCSNESTWVRVTKSAKISSTAPTLVSGDLGSTNGGSGGTSSDTQCSDPCEDCKPTETARSEDDVSLLGGLHLGYNWQLRHRVLGVEADLSFADNIDYLATVRARLGYAQDNLLLYVTGGIAFAGFQGDSITASTGTTFSAGEDGKIGFVVGGGAEYKLRPNWSIGVEGLYYGFGDDEASAYDGSDPCKGLGFAYERDNDLFVVRGRLSYHFQNEYAVPLK